MFKEKTKKFFVYSEKEIFSWTSTPTYRQISDLFDLENWHFVFLQGNLGKRQKFFFSTEDRFLFILRL